MRLLDLLFSRFKLYRKFKGGEWSLVTPKQMPYIDIWVNGKIM